MAHYNTVLHQLVSLLPGHQFDQFVDDLDGDRYVKTFSTRSQLTTLLYAQASGKQSLRDIENALLVHGNRLYHLGLPSKIARSTLSDANSRRDHRIYEKLFYALLARCKDLTPKHRFKFKNPLYSLDSTVIDLCLASFPWAKFRARKGALKLHYQFDHSGELPVFMTMTDGLRADVRVAKSSFPIVPDSIYCFDKGYTDYAWFRRITDEKAFFVTRAKENMVATYVGQHETSKKKGVYFDIVVETGRYWQNYPYPLRLIGYRDAETGLYLEFLTNNFNFSSTTIAQIYKARWQIEIFFKWIKHNLKIKSFLGTSKNAVLTQIWIAMCYYLLLAYVKYQARYRASLFYLHRIVQETLMDRVGLIDLLNLSPARLARLRRQERQLCLQL